MNVTENYLVPDSLYDVIFRIQNGGKVYGFELHLLAEYVSS